MITAGLFLLVRYATAGCQHCTYPPPETISDVNDWYGTLKNMRKSSLDRIGYKGGVFDTPELQWTQHAYIQPQMHPYDRFFYDPVKGYTVDRFLNDLKDRYGGVDAILMWPTYTNIGSDDRNQFDYFRAMPGGLDGVKNVTAQLKARGVRVLWPYNPWDHGTRREPLSDEDTFAKLLKQTGGDGFNGDTMGFVPQSFWDAAEKIGYPIAFEPEGGGTDDALNWSTMGWGYWSYPQAPMVDRFKFLTRGKFMQNICARWAQSKTDNLHSAWFNGAGYESWENVWGTWNGIVPRDGEALRRVASMLRFFGGRKESYCWGGSTVDFLHSPDWRPYVRGAMQQGVFASQFPGKVNGSALYTFVNRGGKNITGQQFWVLDPPKGARFYDCYRGEELTLEKPKQPPPPPAPAPDGYTHYVGANSFSGHGGKDIDLFPKKNLTVKQCTARCDADKKCNCVTYQANLEDPSKNECWKRSECQPADFQYNTGYDVYFQINGYTTWPNHNCYNGHGGTEIDSDKTAPKGLTVSQCMSRCDADVNCSCATYKAQNGQCWKEANCEPVHFEDRQKEFQVFVNQSKQPQCPSCPPLPTPPPPGSKALSFEMEANGYGCVLQNMGDLDSSVKEFFETMKRMTERPLYTYDDTWRYLNQTMVDIPQTKLATSPPKNMKYVPHNKHWKFSAYSVVIEGDDRHGVDVQYPWEDHPQRAHSATLSVGPFYIDKYPVTTTEYADYLAATGYKPHDTYNWLKNWEGHTTPPLHIADRPVTYVSLNEARLYCAHRGARLPHSYEWQYAAQGNDGRMYPWGNNRDQSKYPRMSNGQTFPGPESVRAHPGGASPFGVEDLVGNVYQYTDEFQDAHTRAVVVRGGSNYRPSGSHWYFPQALELNKHEKYFLMSDRYERAGTIGFRCLVDSKH